MKRNRLHSVGSFLLAGALLLTVFACDLDVTNPNSASEEQVLTTSEGVVALAVGVQQFYATAALEAILLYPGITSRELAINTTFAYLIELEDGGPAITGGNSRVLALWSRCYRVIQMADDLIENAPKVRLADGTRSGIVALAHLFKAMSLGYLAQAFEQAPIDVSEDGKGVFVPRQELFSAAIALLDQATQILSDTPPSSEFTSEILGSGFDLENTVQAYRARYNLLAGRYQQAIDAANAVNPSATSVFSYDDQNPNPIYQGVFIAEDYAPRDNFGTTLTEPGDGRLDFYLIPEDKLSDPSGFPVDGLAGFFTSASAPIPAYLPGEMRLIKAEAYLMLGDTDAAVAEIDAIRTKQPAEDPFGIGAALPAYTGPTTIDALKEEIFRQRSAELFLTGMRWEDSRRLGQPGPSSDPFQRNRNFYPYPDQERLNNPNTPPDPES